MEIKRNQFNSNIRLGFADVPERRQFVHDKAEIQTHGYILVSDGGHRSTLLTTEPMWRSVPGPEPAAGPYQVPQTAE